MLMSAGNSVLAVVDVQERLAPATAEPDLVVRNCATLMAAADRLSIPVLFSEQYPRGLGRTVTGLREGRAEDSFIEKLHFSCAGEPAFLERLRSLDRRQVVIAGMEAHVCVLQTAVGLKAAGYDVFVAADAITSRAPSNKALALARMERAGIEIVSVEMVLFEWMHVAGTDEFRDISRLIK